MKNTDTQKKLQQQKKLLEEEEARALRARPRIPSASRRLLAARGGGRPRAPLAERYEEELEERRRRREALRLKLDLEEGRAAAVAAAQQGGARSRPDSAGSARGRSSGGGGRWEGLIAWQEERDRKVKLMAMKQEQEQGLDLIFKPKLCPKSEKMARRAAERRARSASPGSSAAGAGGVGRVPPPPPPQGGPGGAAGARLFAEAAAQRARREAAQARFDGAVKSMARPQILPRSRQLIQGPPGQEALPAHERLHRLAADQWERRQRQTRGRSLDAVPGLGSGGQGAYVYNVGEAGGRGVSPPRPPSPPPRREGGEFAPKINARSRELAARRLRPEGRPVETVLLQAKEEYDRRRAARAELEERKAQALQDAKKTNERSAALVAAMPGRQQVRSVERLHRGLLPHGKRTSRPEEDPTFHPLVSAGSRRILERKEQALGGGGAAAADIAQRTRAWLDQRSRNDRRRTERARRREMEECSFAPLMEGGGGGGGGGGSPRGAGGGTARRGSGGGSPPTAAAAGKARRGSGGTAGGLSSDGGASAGGGGGEEQAGRTKAFLERYAKDLEGKDIGERAASFLKRRQDRLDAARKEKTEKELEGYTFKPDMLASKTSEKLAVKRTSVIPVTPKTQQWWYEDGTNGGKTDASRSSGQGSSNFRNLLSKPSDNLSAIGPRPTFPQSGTPPGPPSHTGIGQRISDEEKRSGLDHSAQSDFQERSQNSTTGRNCGIPEESALLDSAAAKLENFINVTSKVGGGDESGMRNGIENADDVGDEAGPPLGGGNARENLLKEVGRARLEIRQSNHLFEDQTPSGGEMNTKKKLGVEMTSSFEHLETTLQDFNRYNAPSPYLVDSSARPGQSFFNKKSATASTSQQFVGDEEHLPIRRNSHRQPPKRQSVSSEPAADENGLPDISQGRSETSKTAHYNSGGATSNTIASSAHHGDAGPCSAEGVTPEGEEEDSSTKRKLPPGWLEFFSDEGIPYYYNALAGKTQWEIPGQEEGDGFHE